MSKTLVSLPQITPPPTIESNSALLTNIARFAALNPKEQLALRVWLNAKELANDSTSPLTTYDPATASKVMALIQAANTVFGHIPVGDLDLAALVIDWANCKEVFASLPSEVDSLRNSANMGLLSEMTNEDLKRAILFLKMEIGS